MLEFDHPFGWMPSNDESIYSIPEKRRNHYLTGMRDIYIYLFASSRINTIQQDNSSQYALLLPQQSYSSALDPRFDKDGYRKKIKNCVSEVLKFAYQMGHLHKWKANCYLEGIYCFL